MNQPEVEDSNTSSGSKRGGKRGKNGHISSLKNKLLKDFALSAPCKANIIWASLIYLPTDVIDTFMQNFLWCGQHYALKIEKGIYKIMYV